MSTTSELKALNAVGKGGADLSLPDRGTSTGMNGDSYGADLSVDATNRMGGMKSATQSDTVFTTKHEEC